MKEYIRYNYGSMTIPETYQRRGEDEAKSAKQVDLTWITGGSYNEPIRKNRRDFIIRPMEYSCVVSRHLEKELSHLFEENDSKPFFELFIERRNKYVKEGKQLDLQLSSLAIRLALYGSLKKYEKTRFFKLGYYLKNTIRYGPFFSNWLKKARSFATLLTFSEVVIKDLSEKISDLNKNSPETMFLDPERRYNYDDFLNEQYLIFWDDPTVNDTEWAFKPIEYDSAMEDIFFQACMNILETSKIPIMTDPTTDDTATWVSDSSSFDSDKEINVVHRTKCRQMAFSKADNFGKMTKDFKFKRQIIPVAPANFRDSWAPDFDTLFTIKSISYYMRQIIEDQPYSAMYDPVKAHKKKSFLRKDDGTLYFIADFKKSALTVPRWLLRKMGEALELVYPEVEAFKYIKYYENLKVLIDGKWVTPPRGVGLGNMNELFTLMQCVFGSIVNRAYGTDSIFFNDDANYELKNKRWTTQVPFIISLIQSTGNILNLSKCVISKCNVFCEDHITHSGFQYDYSKSQLFIVPFSGVLLQRTTWEAKRFFYSLDRSLVGNPFRFIAKEILKEALIIYVDEFKSLDPYLPYHLGGWFDYSTSNFSCLIEFIINPQKYLWADVERGRIPEIRKWSYFLIMLSLTGKGLLSNKASIPYKGPKIENSVFKEFRFKTFTNFHSYMYDYAQIQKPEDIKQTIDEIINHRGLKGAKPQILAGLAFKEEKRRRLLFVEFKEYKKNFPHTFHRSMIGLAQVQRAIKEIPDSPDYYSYPEIFLKRYWEVKPSARAKHSLLVRKREELSSYSPGSIRRKMSSTIQSLSEKRWYAGSDPFLFQDIWKRRKTGYLISDKPIIREERYGNPPPNFKSFCPNKALFIAEFQSRTGKCPVEWLEVIDIHSDYNMPDYKDAFDIILPSDLRGRWKDLKYRFRRFKSYLRYFLSLENLIHHHEFKQALEILETIMTEITESQEPSPSFEENLGIEVQDLMYRFSDESVFRSLIRSEYTLDDILDEEYDDYNLSELEDSVDIFSEADYEEYAAENDSEEEEDLIPNEMRKIHRKEFSEI